MTEMDFDELDKAVNNLMGGVDTTKQNAALDDPEEKTVSLGQPGDTSTPPPTLSPDQPAAAATLTTPSLAVKRRGQFMDFMHPSSNMKSVVSPAPISRQGVAVAPTTTDIVPAQPAVPVVVPEVPPAPQFDMESTGTQIPEPVTTELQPTMAISASGAPIGETSAPIESAAPVDMIAAQDTALEAAAEPIAEPVLAPDTTSPEPSPAVSTPDLPPAEASEPLGSPFLPDAKVEKRPLGEYAAVVPEPSDIPSIEPTAVPDEMSSQPVGQLETAPLPNELASDVTTVEPSTVVPEQPAVSPVSDTATAGGSIAQQYAEQPSSGDQTNGSIYDTATYHQAIDAPAQKKTSPLKLIIWAIILLLVGAAAAAAYYYFTHQ